VTYGAASTASVPRVQCKSVASRGGYCHASDSERHDTRKPPLYTQAALSANSGVLVYYFHKEVL
jgi:hypothetical protein